MINDYNQGFTRIKPQSRRAHGGRTTETTINQEQICGSFSSAHNKENGKSLRTLRLCGNNSSLIIKTSACESAKSSLCVLCELHMKMIFHALGMIPA